MINKSYKIEQIKNKKCFLLTRNLNRYKKNS